MMSQRTVLVVLAAAAPPLLLAATGVLAPMAGFASAVAAGLLCWLALRLFVPVAPVETRQRSTRADQLADPVRGALIHLPWPVLLVDPQERVELANQAAARLFRQVEPRILLSTLVRHPDVLAVARTAMQTGQPGRARLIVRQHEERFMQLSALPLDGGYLALMFDDETAQYQAEHMRAGFLANASHELRTPLASLRGYIDTLRGHARHDPDAQARFLDIMAGQAERMGRLIDDLLTLSRIEMDEHLPPRTRLDMGQVLQDVCDALTPIAAGRKVALTITAPQTPTLVMGERDQMVQMVQNLVDNAIKYAPPGTNVRLHLIDNVKRHDDAMGDKALDAKAPRLHIVAAATEPTQVFALLRVRDDGPGIAEEHLPRLGGRFYRVEQGKSGTHTGTGLGLAIVKHIIARHRGALTVESLPGRGSVFTAALPKP